MAYLLRLRNAIRKVEGRYGHSAETRARMSARMTQAIAEGRINKRSKLEVRVGEILEEFGVTAIPQYPFRNDAGRFCGVVDFYLPEHHTALEVNGTFWHTDPRVYPNGPTHKSQKRTAIAYERKRKMLQKQGIRLIEVWELDFKNDAHACVKTALATL